jgi:hypothetical protein
MSPKPIRFASWLAAAAVAGLIGGAPIAAADPSWPVAGAESASDTIDDLQAQGYDVQINWVNGYPRVPLSECWVRAIHNPDRSGQPPTTFTTVYVDVSCPNHEWDGGGGGISVGIG